MAALGRSFERPMTAIQLSLLGGQQEARTSDDYYTPRWVFDTMGITFDLDVACPPEGPIHVPAARYYTAADDGLAQPWEGRVWMNPPFSKTTPWALRFIDHANGIALVPFAKSKWACTLWDAADGIVMLPSTFKFEGGSIFIQTMLAAFGDENVAAINKIGRVR